MNNTATNNYETYPTANAEGQENYCPICRNHCPVNALRCGRGISYFDKTSTQISSSTDSPENAVEPYDTLEHSSDKRHMHSAHDSFSERKLTHGKHSDFSEGDNAHGGHRSASRHKGIHEYSQFHEPDTSLYGLMRQSGHYLFHHSGAEISESVDSSSIFHALTTDEQEQLRHLLTKLVTSWFNAESIAFQ